MTDTRALVGRDDRSAPWFDAGGLFVRRLALAAWILASAAGVSHAFVATPEQDSFDILLPFQRESLVYGNAVASLDLPPVAASIESRLGGDWVVHSWNRRSGSPHYILGSGADVAPAFRDPSDAESAAYHVLGENAEALHVNVEQLRLAAIRQGAGKSAVHFQQTYGGLDVIGGRVHATFLDTGRLFVMGADFYSVEDLSVVPVLSQQEAERIALDALPHRERVVSPQAGEASGLYVLPYPTSLESFAPRLVWKVTIVTDGRTGVFPTCLDANTGEILWRYNDVHYVNYSGNTEGRVDVKTYCDGEKDERLDYMEVSIAGVGTANSNHSGQWVIPNGDSTTRVATTRFFGPFVDVNRASGGSDAVLSANATPGTPLILTWNDANSRQDERDVFHAVSDMHDFFEDVDPGYSLSNARITANVGVPGSCNAFWNGTINFYDQAGGCANTGEIQSVVHHEFGHGVQHNLIGEQGSEGLGEGNSDILANFMTRESTIGRGFFLGACTTGIRDSDNTLQYPEDMTGQVHHDGQIIAGVVWGAAENLENALGAAGREQAIHIWHFGRKLEMPTNQPDQVLSMFIADDNNGNLMDGTPNYSSLCPAVVAHDVDHDAFDCADPTAVWVDFGYVGPEDGSMARPYNSVLQAHAARPAGYIMKIVPGSSSEVGVLSKPGEIRKMGSGVVRIGAP